MAKESTSPPQGTESVLDEVAEIAGYLWDRRWAERNAGGISIDVTDQIKNTREVKTSSIGLDGLDVAGLARRSILLTVPASRMRDLARRPGNHAGIIRINEDSSGYRVVWGDPRRLSATASVVMHLRIQNLLRVSHPELRVVLHTHPESLIAMTQMAEFKDEFRVNSVLWGMHPQSLHVVPNGVGLVRYLRAGTPELVDATVRALTTNAVVLLEKHGCFAVGNNLSDTFDMIDTLEKSARIFFRVKSTGRTPEGLSDDQLQDLRLAFLGGNEKQ
ncbi:MAG: rhamnulose-1-phosphate aldolase [Bacteroidota bacterium]